MVLNLFIKKIQVKMEGPEVFNFAAGPCCLPKSILLEAQAELLSWNGR